jgi:hypothetical protein
MMPYPLVQRPSKYVWFIQEEGHCCEGWFPGVAEIENVTVCAMGKRQLCQKVGKSASETFQMIKQAYGEEALGRSAVFKGHKRFAQGRDSLEDGEHTHRPRTVRTELKIIEVAMLVRANHFQMVDELATAAAAGISHSTYHNILSDDLNMSHVTQHSVSCVLMQDHHDDHISTCSDLIDSANRDGAFLSQIITRGETWCFLYHL